MRGVPRLLSRHTSGVFALLMGSYLVIIFVTLAVLATSFSVLFQSFFVRTQQRKFVSQGRQVASMVASSVEAESRADLYGILSIVDRLVDGQIWVADRTGLVLASSDRAVGLRLAPDDVEKVLMGKVVTKSGRVPHFPEPMLFVAVPISLSKAPVGAVIIYSPLAGIDATILEVRRLSLIAAAISILLALLMGLRLSRSLSRPLAEMSEIAGSMARGQFHRRVKVSGHNEVAGLGMAFNNLAEGLARTITTLQAEKLRTESILNSMAEGVIAVDAVSRLIAANPRAMAMFPALGVLPVLGPQAPHEVLEGFRAVLSSGDMAVLEMHGSGGTILLSHFTPIKDDLGRVTGAVGVFQDISQRWRLEHMQREFVANVSHELRTPLTSIQGFNEAIADGVVTDMGEVRRLCGIVVDEARRLGRLVADLLDLEKMETGYLRLDLAPVPLTSLVTRVSSRLRDMAASAGVALSIGPAPVADVALAEPDRIEQVVLNLITNAIQHSPGGSVTATLREDGDFLVCTVSDTGVGIPAEELPRIWDRFHRGPDGGSRLGGGTGLGLAIVRQITELHGGYVSAISEPGQGSSFSFALPRVPQPLE